MFVRVQLIEIFSIKSAVFFLHATSIFRIKNRFNIESTCPFSDAQERVILKKKKFSHFPSFHRAAEGSLIPHVAFQRQRELTSILLLHLINVVTASSHRDTY